MCYLGRHSRKNDFVNDGGGGHKEGMGECCGHPIHSFIHSFISHSIDLIQMWN